MAKLELKIPPLLLTGLFAVLMGLCAWCFPSIKLNKKIRWFAFILCETVGAVFALAGVFSFRQAETTLNPTTPAASSSLVTAGVYQYSRNPMYVGFLCFLLGWGCFLANLYALVLCGGFVLYMNHFQIKPEEKYLHAQFGADYVAYIQQVRRWL